MARKSAKPREWTKADVRLLKTLAREKRKTTAIARTLRRSVSATRQKGYSVGISFGRPARKARRA